MPEEKQQSSLPARVLEEEVIRKAEVLDRFINFQEQEIDVRRQELELKHKEEDHAFEYANASLNAQVADRNQERDLLKTVIGKSFVFAGIVIIAFIVFLAYALYLDQPQIVSEIIKAIVYIFCGGAGGFAAGRFTRPKKDADNNDLE